MAIAREDFFRKLFYRLQGEGHRLCRCQGCGAGPMYVRDDVILTEPCEACGAVAWRDVTEEEFASETKENGLLALSPSACLASELKRLDDGEPEEWTLQRELIRNLEGFADKSSADWLSQNLEHHADILAYVFDEFYTREFLEKAREVVERTIQLSAISPTSTPDRGVNFHLRETTRCYIFGFWDSSVALARATLELALKNRVAGNGDPLDCAHDRGLIDAAHLEMARQVRRNGNKVLHDNLHPSRALAWETLSFTRGVLAQLYSC